MAKKSSKPSIIKKGKTLKKSKKKDKPIPKKIDKWMKRKTSIHRSVVDNEPLVLSTLPKQESALRLDKNQRWPSKPKEHFDQRRKIFKSYLENQLDYPSRDILLLLKLWDLSISTDNIMGYVHCSTPVLYQGLINNNLSLLYRQPE